MAIAHLHSFAAQMSSFFRSTNCCFGGSDGSDDEFEDTRKVPMVISSPTNFRREEINLPLSNLTPEDQAQLCEKAKADAERMWHNLRPLASSPSGQFAERPMPTFEEFTVPRPAPTPGERRGSGSLGRGFEKVQMHARKISGALTGHQSAGYKAPPTGLGMGRASREGSPMEMRSPMDPSKTVVGGAAQQAEGKMSGESSGLSGDEVDGESGKVVVGKI